MIPFFISLGTCSRRLPIFLFSVCLVFAFGKDGITKVIPKRSLTLSSAVNYQSTIGFAVRAGAILCGLNRATQSYSLYSL